MRKNDGSGIFFFFFCIFTSGRFCLTAGSAGVGLHFREAPGWSGRVHMYAHFKGNEILRMKMYKRMESYAIARLRGQTENGKHMKYRDKKRHTWILKNFSLLKMWLNNACISVWKLQNSKHFSLVQKSSSYLEYNKSYDRLHSGTAAQNSSQIPVREQGFVGSPPHPGCIMIYSYHQMCPALNSKP